MITSAEIEAVRKLIRDHPDGSRRRISLEVCASWDWRNAKGELRDMACRTVLLRLHRIQAEVKDVYVYPLVKDFREALRHDHA